MAALNEARVPDIGDYADVPVIEILVAPGDTVVQDQGLITLESDKATLEVPAPFAGVIRELKVNLGDTLSAGSVVALIEPAHATAPPAPTSPAASIPAEPPPPTTAPSIPAAPTVPAPLANNTTPEQPPIRFQADVLIPGQVPYASPAIRLLARELGVDLMHITGSAKGGRIVREDLQRYVKNVLAGANATSPKTDGSNGLDLLPWPNVDFAKFGPVTTEEPGRIQKLSAANLARNWVRIPHVTQHDLADITALEALRLDLNNDYARQDIKLTMLAFLIKASVAVLKRYPRFNASLDATGQILTLKQYYHIGFAADTPNGLVVPVLRDADQKGVIEIARETAALAKKAREGKLGPADMQGGCFTISSLGGIGGTAFTPIVNAPEVAILGVSKSTIQPVWDGTQFQPRLMLPLSLSYDHRVIDGAAAARFTATLAQLLADMRRVLL